VKRKGAFFYVLRLVSRKQLQDLRLTAKQLLLFDKKDTSERRKGIHALTDGVAAQQKLSERLAVVLIRTGGAKL
jgi:hypothetical protein